MDKIDIVIPLHDQSKVGYIDLIYTLRSIEKNLSNYRDVYLVGKKPNFIKNVINIPFNQSKNDDDKQKNILNKIIYCLNMDEISENILFINDEHFLLSNFDSINFPNYQDGNLEKQVFKNPYTFTINNTIRFLESKNSEIKNFDIHTPIIYNKKKFKEVFESIQLPRFGYGIKSIYGNLAQIKSEYMEDCKISHALSKEEAEEICKYRKIVSCSDVAIKTGLGEHLKEMFPKKSKFETK